MITTEQIRDNLKEAIKQSGVTQTALAEQLHIYQSAVQQYVSDKTNTVPALATFANICAILDLDANEILCLNSQQKGQNDNKKAVRISDSFNNNTGNINFKA